jgi:hypothetical protein
MQINSNMMPANQALSANAGLTANAALATSNANCDCQPAKVEKSHGQQSYSQRDGLSVDVFSQQLHASLRSSFTHFFSGNTAGYGDTNQASNSPEQAASSALRVARSLVLTSGSHASKSLMQFREKVNFAAAAALSASPTPAAQNAVAETTGLVNAGLNQLDAVAANNQAASASVLNIDTSSYSKASVTIRTQEGDVVKLSLRQSSSFSASDVSVASGDSSASQTEVALSSQSGLRLRVEGDISNEELTAIKDIFSKAVTMADEFFGGDIEAALADADSFSFDTTQIAAVNLRFKSIETTKVTYASLTQLPTTSANNDNAAPAITDTTSPASTSPTSSPAAAITNLQDSALQSQILDSLPTTPDTTTPVSTSESQPSENVALVSTPAETTSPSASPSATTTPAATPAPTPADSFDISKQLATFMRKVSSGFSVTSDAKGSSIRYHYSESLKISLLKAVIHATVPAAIPGATPTTSPATEQAGTVGSAANSVADNNIALAA